MAHLLRRRIKELEDKNTLLENELSEWREVGDCILKFYHWKKILKSLKRTKFILLMANYKQCQEEEVMKKLLDEQLFGASNASQK